MRKYILLGIFLSFCILLFHESVLASPRATGRKAVTSAGTAERLISSDTWCSMIQLTAFAGNTDAVAVGNASVVASSATRTGLVLFPGQTEYLYGTGSARLNLRDTWIDSVVNSEGATWNCFN